MSRPSGSEWVRRLIWRPSSSTGSTADARTDIYAFGLVLYEMATGGRPSSKPSSPPPPALDRLVKRCLEAAPDDRWQSARDLEWELGSVGKVPSSAPPVRGIGCSEQSLGLLALLLIGLAVVHFSEAPPRPAPVRMSILLPEKSRVRALAGFTGRAADRDGSGSGMENSRSGSALWTHRSHSFGRDRWSRRALLVSR